MQPHLKFKLNKKLDRSIAWDIFQEPEAAGFDFWETIVDLHDGLSGAREAKNQKKFIFRYVNRLYKEKGAEFEKRAKEIEAMYRGRESSIISAIDNVFQNSDWPDGKYTVFPSVFSVNPRFLDTKTFQVFLYAPDEAVLLTIAHELLHFRFYDYCLKTRPDVFAKLDTERGPFWDMAEVFNVLIQRTPAFVAIHGRPGAGYPAHEKIIADPNIAWNDDINDWINRYIPYHIFY